MVDDERRQRQPRGPGPTQDGRRRRELHRRLRHAHAHATLPHVRLTQPRHPAVVHGRPLRRQLLRAVFPTGYGRTG